jgi:sirohydrochlorin ferrochelatase
MTWEFRTGARLQCCTVEEDWPDGGQRRYDRCGMEKQHTVILLFAHGSAVEEANHRVAALAAEVSRRARCPVSCAFLEIAQPDLDAAVAESAGAGARRIVVIPYFLTMGVHVSEDLPRLIKRQEARFPGVEILAGQSLEGSPGMADLILDRVREALEGARQAVPERGEP